MILKKGLEADEETEDSRKHNQTNADARRRIETNLSE